MKFFDTNCKFLRKSKGFSQAEMASQLGVSRTTWTGYEKKASQPNLSGLYKIAEYFNLSIAQLLEVDLKENVHLSKKDKDLKKQENVLLNVLPNVLLKDYKSAYSKGLHITVAAEPEVNITKRKQRAPLTDITAEVLILKDNQTKFNHRLKIMEAQVNDLIKKLK